METDCSPSGAEIFFLGAPPPASSLEINHNDSSFAVRRPRLWSIAPENVKAAVLFNSFQNSLSNFLAPVGQSLVIEATGSIP